MGPETDTAATTKPVALRTGAETEVTPGSRSPTDCAQPRRRTSESIVALKAAPRRPRCSRSGSSHASKICADEPAFMVSTAPTGIESRRPMGRSAVATQMRWSPWRRYSWQDSWVWSRSAFSTGADIVRSRSSPAAPASSVSRGPRVKRPCESRVKNRWCSKATARR